MQQGNNLGEVIGLLIAAPFVAVADYFGWIKKQPPGQQELAKACHGAGMLALLWYCCSLAGGVAEYLAGLMLYPGELLQWIPVGMGAWGLAWLLLNARQAALSIAPSQRATMIMRALIKLALGWALWSWADAGDAWLPGLVFVVAVWCFATGGAKLLLMLWGRRSGQAEPLVTGDIAAKEFDWDEGRL
jgi:hypothetical protein